MIPRATKKQEFQFWFCFWSSRVRFCASTFLLFAKRFLKKKEKMNLRPTLIVAILVSISIVSVESVLEKSIIKYLGTSFLMADGCPLPKCDTSTADCVRTHSMVRNLYTHCLQSEEGQHVGCVTDKMPDGTLLTLPIYASVCSAMCYEPPQGLARVKKCPYPGEREQSPDLTQLFD